MSKEEYTIKLDMVATFEDKQVRIEDLLEQLFEENKQLKDNWNKLKEWAKKAVNKYYDCDIRIEMLYQNVLNKMQEIEKGESK